MRNFTVEVLPKFPARVDEGPGISIVRANGVYTFGVSGDNLAEQGSVPDPANTGILVFLPDGTPALVPVSVAQAAVAPAVQQTGKRNALVNGGMMVWQRGTTFVPTTARMMTADRWGVKTAAGTLTSVARTAVFSPLRGSFGLTLTGNAGVTTVDLDQRLEAVHATPLRYSAAATFSARIFNNTAAALTPTLFVDTPSAADNWASSTAQNNAGAGDPLQSCPNGATTLVSWSAAIGAYANIANGVGFRLSFPSGALNLGTKTIGVFDVQVEPVAAVGIAPSLFEIENFGDELARCQRYFQKTFPYGTAPAQNAGIAGAFLFTQSIGASLQQSEGQRLMAVMRVQPTTVTLYNPGATNSQIRNFSGSTDWSASVCLAQGDNSLQIGGTSPAGSVVNSVAILHVTADAEL